MPSANPAPIYVESFRIDVSRTGMALITFGSPIIESGASAGAPLLPTVRVAMTEENLAELAKILSRRVKDDSVLKLRGGAKP